MPKGDPDYPDPSEEDIYAGDRRISRPDASVPDWEVPDSSYRPIPIVWFTGAMLLQIVTFTVVFMALISAPGYFTSVICGLLTGLIGAWTWRRGMAGASLGWRIATVIMLVTQLAFLLLAISNRL